jgi:holin, phage phi LC3 family|nr:MAG TPA: holin [Caudoviricetes sp.]
MINVIVRIKNRTFWLALIPAVLLLIQVVAAPFGYQWDFVALNRQLADIVNALFAVLAIVGVVVDPTTKGISDSARAMTYVQPSERPASYMTGNAEPINTKPAEEPKEEVNNA